MATTMPGSALWLIALGRNYPASVVPTTMILDRHHRVAAVILMAVLAGICGHCWTGFWPSQQCQTN